MQQLLTSLWSNMLHFIYPRLCLGCAKTLMAQEDLLCIECNELLPLTDYHHILHNESYRRFEGRISVEQATSLAYYTKEGLLQYLLHEFKYKGNKKIAILLGSRLAFALSKTDWIKGIDLIVPVPLHEKKIQSRGYNQSDLIAQKISLDLSIPIHSSSLVRLRNTETQTHKSREQRTENMSYAFGLKDTSDLTNKHILLLDDVLTTGATLESCVQTLSAVPGIKVSIATIGIATN